MTDLRKFNSIVLLGLKFTLDEQIRDLEGLSKMAKRADAGLEVHFLNSYNLFVADRDEAYKEIINNSNINFCDGKPFAIASKFISKDKITQVRGPSFFEDCLSKYGKSLSHFFVGGNIENSSLLLNKLTLNGVNIAGMESPPFRELTSAELASRDNTIRSANPDVIWVGLGTPKQDFEVARLAKKHNAVVVAVGAAFDFYAGSKKEAPWIVQRIGLEWLFRLLTEPRRLFKRYLLGNAHFIKRFFAAAISGRRGIH